MHSSAASRCCSASSDMSASPIVSDTRLTADCPAGSMPAPHVDAGRQSRKRCCAHLFLITERTLPRPQGSPSRLRGRPGARQVLQAGATKDPMQQAVRDALIGFMAATAQAQAEAAKAAQKAGIEHAKAKDGASYLGRKPSYTRQQFTMVRHMLGQDPVGIARVAKKSGLTRQTVYRIKDDRPAPKPACGRATAGEAAGVTVQSAFRLATAGSQRSKLWWQRVTCGDGLL